MSWSSSIVVLVGVLMAVAPADQTAIRAALVAQNKAIAAGDLDQVASFWTDDVTVRRALGQPVSGRALRGKRSSRRRRLHRVWSTSV